MSIIHRRSFLTGLAASAIAAPAIVRAASLMPVKALQPWLTPTEIVNRALHRIAIDQRDWTINSDYAVGQLIRVRGGHEQWLCVSQHKLFEVAHQPHYERCQIQQ